MGRLVRGVERDVYDRYEEERAGAPATGRALTLGDSASGTGQSV
ncbi:hypothetical protein [Pusillimonas caeni]|nr:hypothetical protein [Pusillimonas caeni]